MPLLAGRHEFPFTFTLPPNLPSSYESCYGEIRYTVKAVVDRPWKFNHESIRAFSVNAVLNLNMEPLASVSISLRTIFFERNFNLLNN